MRHAASAVVFGLGLGLALASLDAQAFDLAETLKESEHYVHINGKSRHFVSDQRRRQLRETNSGIGLEVRQSDGWFAMAGTYVDSYSSHAWYAGAGKRWTFFEKGPAKLSGGLVGFLTHRKHDMDDDDKKFLPGILPVLTAEIGPVGINMLYIPETPLTKDAPTAFVQLSLRFR